MGEVTAGGPNYGIVTGDGGSALDPAPLFTPAIAKEVLFLAKPFDRSRPRRNERDQLRGAGESELDAKVDEMVEALLRRSVIRARVDEAHRQPARSRTI